MMEFEHRFSLTNNLAGLGTLQEEWETLAAGWNVSPGEIYKINLVLDELFTNIVHYAYPEGGDHQIQFIFGWDGRRLRIVIADDGRPFDPLTAAGPDVHEDLTARPVGGLGIHLVRTFMDRMAYRREDGRNVLTIEKSINTGE